jgi:hypothetical protein
VAELSRAAKRRLEGYARTAALDRRAAELMAAGMGRLEAYRHAMDEADYALIEKIVPKTEQDHGVR